MSAARPQLWADLQDGRVTLALVLNESEISVLYMGPSVTEELGNRLLDLAEAARW